MPAVKVVKVNHTICAIKMINYIDSLSNKITYRKNMSNSFRIKSDEMFEYNV